MSYTFEHSDSLGKYNNIRDFINIYLNRDRLISLEVESNKIKIPICKHMIDMIDGKQPWSNISFVSVSPDYGAHIHFGLLEREGIRYVQIFEGYRIQGTIDIIIPFDKCEKFTLKKCLYDIINVENKYQI